MYEDFPGKGKVAEECILEPKHPLLWRTGTCHPKSLSTCRSTPAGCLLRHPQCSRDRRRMTPSTTSLSPQEGTTRRHRARVCTSYTPPHQMLLPKTLQHRGSQLWAKFLADSSPPQLMLGLQPICLSHGSISALLLCHPVQPIFCREQALKCEASIFRSCVTDGTGIWLEPRGISQVGTDTLPPWMLSWKDSQKTPSHLHLAGA